jgi:hypothetical protein
LEGDGFVMKYQLPLDNSLIVDNFACGVGASCGIELALTNYINSINPVRTEKRRIIFTGLFFSPFSMRKSG